MKRTVVLQVAGVDKDIQEIEKEAKEQWKQSGYLVKDIKSLSLYLKADEQTCYFVINDEFKGAIPITQSV
ncbi:DUF6465 family protein [Rossellomorea marisflavi]|uniref:DUF6465 family protein n=1 Tax=Rossellomorea marisflavi TaxID=189381 RepID=UPI003FA116C1